jgi:hypothetical protein
MTPPKGSTKQDEGVDVPEAEPDTADAAPEGDKQSAGANTPAETKNKKQPLPEGFVTPTELSHILTERWHGQTTKLEASGEEVPLLPANETVRPQIIYGYVKNGSGFPSSQAPDGRVMVNKDEAVAWCDERQVKKLNRNAKKAAEAAAATADAASEEEPAEAS